MSRKNRNAAGGGGRRAAIEKRLARSREKRFARFIEEQRAAREAETVRAGEETSESPTEDNEAFAERCIAGMRAALGEEENG